MTSELSVLDTDFAGELQNERRISENISFSYVLAEQLNQVTDYYNTPAIYIFKNTTKHMESDPVTESKKRSFVNITAQELKYRFRSKLDLLT